MDAQEIIEHQAEIIKAQADVIVKLQAQLAQAGFIIEEESTEGTGNEQYTGNHF